MEIHARNVNDAFSSGLMYLRTAGIREESRNGAVIVAPEPVLTVYSQPQERVLFSPLRNANPFMHLFESLWMLAGRDDVAFPAQFAKNLMNYSDDGQRMHGAYGFRWRKWFGYDQLNVIARELGENPSGRRCVLSMWDATGVGATIPENRGYESMDLAELPDLLYARTKGSKDAPCNTHAYFTARDGHLDMTICCRSNDMIWGGYGANAVHFSVLLEYMAKKSGLEIGTYRQFSNNFHVYENYLKGLAEWPGEDWKEVLRRLSWDAERHDDGYALDFPASSIINVPITKWEQDLALFFANPDDAYAQEFYDPFFKHCAVPMYVAWKQRKAKTGTGLEILNRMQPAKHSAQFTDWQLAATQWIERREAKKASQENAGK